jgi:hypothetical protein
VQSVTPKRSTTIEAQGRPSFRYVHLPAHLFFGFAPDEARVFRADPEKALLDLLYVQRGRVDWESISIERLDPERLQHYGVRFPAWVHRALPPSAA